MIETGLSIRDRTGKIDHNFRITRKKDKEGNYIPMHRAHIDEERSQFNIILEQADRDPFKCVERVYRDNMTDALKDYNAEQIRKGHPERIRTVESYMADIETSYAKDRKRNPPLFHEKVIKVGDKNSMPSFGYDENGNKVLSEEGKKSIAILTDYYYAFKKKNPNLKICACVIHCDEAGAIHMHLDYIGFSMQNSRGLRIRNSMSGALKEQYATQAIDCKNTRYNNPLKMWTQEQREIVTKLSAEHGVKIIDMESGKRGYLTDKQYRAVMQKIESGELPDLDLPIEKVKMLIGSRNETAEEYQKRVFPIIKELVKKKSDAERFQRMRADSLEEKMKHMEQERSIDHKRVEQQLSVLKNKDEQERYKQLQIDLQRANDDEIARLSLAMQKRAEKALQDDRQALIAERQQVASLKSEAQRLKKQATDEVHYAKLEADRLRKNAKEEASEIVSDAHSIADSIIGMANSNKAVVGLIEKNAMSILRKEHSDLVKVAEHKAWAEFHKDLFKIKKDNQHQNEK